MEKFEKYLVISNDNILKMYCLYFLLVLGKKLSEIFILKNVDQVNKKNLPLYYIQIQFNLK